MTKNSIIQPIEFKRVRGKDRKKRQKRYRSYAIKGALGLAALGATNKLMGTKPGQFINVSRSNLKSAGSAALRGAVNGSILGAAYYGADHVRGQFTKNISNLIQFGRGKDKKKRKRRGTAIDGSVATGAALAGGIGAYKTSTFRDRQNFDLQAQSNPDEVLNRARNNPLNKQRFAEYDSVNENLGASQKAKDKLESLSRQIDDQGVSPKMAQKAKDKLADKYGKNIGDIPALGKQLSQSRNNILSGERLRSVDKLKAGRRALAGAAVAGAGGYALSRVIRRRKENKK